MRNSHGAPHSTERCKSTKKTAFPQTFLLFSYFTEQAILLFCLGFVKNTPIIRLGFIKKIAKTIVASIKIIYFCRRIHARDMKVLPIECKSGTSGKMKSLHLFMHKKHLTVKYYTCYICNS